MENNIIKENCIDVIKEQGVITVSNPEVLPAISMNRNFLMPLVVPYRELSMLEVKREFYTLKYNKTWQHLLKFIKVLAKFLASAVRFLFLSTTNIVTFVGVSAIIITSIAIVTKNTINSYYDAKIQYDETEFSIYKIREDVNF